MDADGADALEAQFKRSTRRRRIIFAVILASLLAGPFLYIFWQRHKVVVKNEAFRAEQEQRHKADEAWRNRPLAPDEAEQLKQLAPRIEQELVAMRDEWTAATTPEALAAIVPGTAACSHSLRPPTAQAADSYVEHGSIDGNYFGNMSFDVFRATEPVPPRDFDKQLAVVGQIAARVRAGKLERRDLAELRELGRGEELVFVRADELREPIVMAAASVTASYDPGVVVGTAYIYSDAQRRITCAGTIAVENSPTVAIRYRYMEGAPMDQEYKAREAARATLQRDLHVQLRRAIATSLKAR